MDENAHPGSGGPFSRLQIDKAPETFLVFVVLGVSRLTVAASP